MLATLRLYLKMWCSKTSSPDCPLGLGHGANFSHLPSPHRLPAGRQAMGRGRSSNHLELVNLFGFSVQHVHGTTQSGVEGTNDPDDVERVLDIRDGCSDESLLNWAPVSFIISWTGVPYRCCDNLVVIDLLVLDRDPVA